MAAHLSHKIRWDFLGDYVTPYVDQGITLPVGECGRIHVGKKKHKIQVDMRNYISEDMICTAEDCKKTGEKIFRKTNKKGKPFARGPREEEKLKMFMESFYNAVHEFALTELNSPAKPVEYDEPFDEQNLLNIWHCRKCIASVPCLEFGDKLKLFGYSDAELSDIVHHVDGNPGVGNHLMWMFHRIIRFYIVSNVIVYLDLRTEDQWPGFMKPKSFFRSTMKTSLF